MLMTNVVSQATHRCGGVVGVCDSLEYFFPDQFKCLRFNHALMAKPTWMNRETNMFLTTYVLGKIAYLTGFYQASNHAGGPGFNKLIDDLPQIYKYV